MRKYPEDKYDQEELARLNAESWQVELLKLNPTYPHWGPYEDYMVKSNDGWESPLIFENWTKFNIDLDELNEVVNFYFSIERENEICNTCKGSGYSVDAQWVTDSFYKHSSPFLTESPTDRALSNRLAMIGIQPCRGVHGQHGGFPSEDTLNKYGLEFRSFCEAMRDGDGFWNDKITQDEADILIKKGRIFTEARTADEINAEQNKHGQFLNHKHDGINRSILTRARCERFKIPLSCETCEGHGYVFTESQAHTALVLWLLHPRKGAGRGVHIKRLEREDINKALAFLREAAQRNADRFSKVVNA